MNASASGDWEASLWKDSGSCAAGERRSGKRVSLFRLEASGNGKKRLTTTGETQPELLSTCPNTAERTVSAFEMKEVSPVKVARRYAEAARSAEPEASEKYEPCALS